MKLAKANNNCSLVVEFSLVKEYIFLQDERITQLYVIQSEQNPFLWFGVLFVDTGIYKGTVIRFNMLIDEKYPNSPCPKIIFDPVPYHPLIDPETGLLDTKNAFPDWNTKTHKFHQLLYFVKRVICQAELYINQIRQLISQHTSSEFQKIDYNDSFDNDELTNKDNNSDILLGETRSQIIKSTTLNDELDAGNYEQLAGSSNTNITSNVINISSNEAFSHNITNLFECFDKTLDCIRVYENNPKEFFKLVDDFKKKVGEQLYDKPDSCNSDANALIFSTWDMDRHEPIRQCILAGRFGPTNLFASYHKETDSVSFVPGRQEE